MMQEGKRFKPYYSFMFQIFLVFRFRALTCNIIADVNADIGYTRNVLHPYCDTDILAADYRKPTIVKEL